MTVYKASNSRQIFVDVILSQAVFVCGILVMGFIWLCINLAPRLAEDCSIPWRFRSNHGLHYGIQVDTCMIESECYRQGDEDPDSSARYCDPAKSQTAWTTKGAYK